MRSIQPGSAKRLVRPWMMGVLACCLPASTGCSLTGLATAIAMQTTPTTETVPAEFDRLGGHTALVYVWTKPEIKWAYPKARLDLAGYVSEYLVNNVQDVTMIDYWDVEEFLEKRSQMQLERVERDLAEEFAADMVIHISVYRLTTRDPGSAHYYRGRLAGSIMIYDFTRPGKPERISLKDLEVTFPEKGPLGLANASESDIRRATYDLFAQELGRKFHEYERDIDTPGGED